MTTFGNMLRPHMVNIYRGALDRHLTARGFVGGAPAPFDAVASATGVPCYVHPSGVAVAFHSGGIRVAYRAPWATPAVDDREAWFDLPYGTSYEVVTDLADALVVKVERDRQDDIEAGHDEMAAQARHDPEPF